MEKALLPLFITIRPPPVWQLWPQCLAVGESSTEGNKNPNVLPSRRESEVAEKLSWLPVTHFLDHVVLTDTLILILCYG